DKKSDPFYHQGYWYYFSYEDMSIYRSRFDGSNKKMLYQKMYHTNSAVYHSNYAKLHRIEFGKDKIYFIDYAENHETSGNALYAMSYDGSSVQKIGAAPSPSDPLKDESDTPEREFPGTFALRVELLLSKMKDAYYHATEDYFKSESTDRKKFVTAIHKAEKLLQNTPPDAHAARELYTELHTLRTCFSMERTRSR
ncbi:MAG: transglutaminase domain-containing protein, partial [Treponema sp.]